MVLISGLFHCYTCFVFTVMSPSCFIVLGHFGSITTRCFGPWPQGFTLVFLFWNKDDSCSVQRLFKLLLSTSPIASSCMCWGVVVASSMFEVSHVFYVIFFAWSLAFVSLRFVGLAAEIKQSTIIKAKLIVQQRISGKTAILAIAEKSLLHIPVR